MTSSATLIKPGLGLAQAFVFSPDQGEVWLGRRGARVSLFESKVAQVHLLDVPPQGEPTSNLAGASPLLASALLQIAEYLQGQRRSFDLPLHLEGSPFFKQVWSELQKVPYGSVLTYGALGARAGNPRASRAVGTAMNRNLLPLLVPCHRVVAAGGKLGGFGCGVEWKRWLLKLERNELGLDLAL